MKCSNCGEMVPEGKLFCGKCGTPLAKKEEKVKKAQSEHTSENKKVKTKTGEKRPSTAIEKKSPEAVKERKNRTSFPRWILIVGGLLFLIILIVIFFPDQVDYLRNTNKPVEVPSNPEGYELTDSETRNAGVHDYKVIEIICHRPGSCPDIEEGFVIEAVNLDFTENGLLSSDHDYERVKPEFYTRLIGSEEHRIIINGDGFLFDTNDDDGTIYSLLLELIK